MTPLTADFFQFNRRLLEWFDERELLMRQSEILALYAQGRSEEQVALFLVANGALGVRP